jgi:hypothetical protein
LDQRAIFIHSLFRTGSTYIYNKFRQQGNCYCYYEPFHESLLNLKNHQQTIDENLQKMMHHPAMNQDYFHEYESFLDPKTSSVPFFRKSFTADEFCYNEANPPLKKYIDFLILQSSGKIPVFQFNRSALRTGWFKSNYPKAINIYLLRHPRDNWMSHITLEKGENPYFAGMSLLIASLNKDASYFKPLAEILPLIDFKWEDFKNQIRFYINLIPVYTDVEQYLIFYFIWLNAMIENVLHADIIINMNRLSENTTYQTDLNNLFKQFNIPEIDFRDAHLPVYKDFPLSVQSMDSVEDRVQRIVFRNIDGNKIKTFLDGLSVEEENYFKINKENLSNPSGLQRISNADKEERYLNIIQMLAKEHAVELKSIDEHLNQKDTYIDSLNVALNRSQTYAQSMEIELGLIRTTKVYKYLIGPFLHKST